jgi:hypothetical protein
MTDTPTLGRPRYGVDAPPLPALLGAAGAAGTLAASRRHTGRTAPAAAGAVLLAGTASTLHTTLRGKLRAWDGILNQAALKSDEHVLDMGCGRGAVLIAAPPTARSDGS